MLVIVATDDSVLNQQVYLDAQARHIFVNGWIHNLNAHLFSGTIDRNPF